MNSWQNNRSSIATKAAACLGLVILADIFFYNAVAGWTAGFFALAVLAAHLALSPHALKSAAALAVAAATGVLGIVLLWSPDTLPAVLFAGGMTVLVVLEKRGTATGAALWFKDSLLFARRMATQWRIDRRMMARAQKRRPPQGAATARNMAAQILLPALLAVVFISLFRAANPVLEAMLWRYDLRWFAGLLSPLRWLYWAAVGGAAWAVLRPRFKLARPVGFSIAGLGFGGYITRGSLIWSLALFNIIFAVQNVMDLHFLWFGTTELPDGVTYARYAHAGAYPLIVTALLAGGYVLAAFDPAQPQLHSAEARRLVTLWVLQNIFLVVSSIDRTLQYVDTYSLTMLRVAALIWMGLVAGGLALILLRVYTGRSNTWLLNANAAMLAAVLYACCFVGFDRVIANYNVAHCREAAGRGVMLDIGYLHALGPATLPALKEYTAIAPPDRRAAAARAIDSLTRELQERQADWRGWTPRFAAGFQPESPR